LLIKIPLPRNHKNMDETLTQGQEQTEATEKERERALRSLAIENLSIVIGARNGGKGEGNGVCRS
jgi:hypothetical protein